MSGNVRTALAAGLLLVVVGVILAWQMPRFGAQATGDTTVDTPSPTASITPTPTAIPPPTPPCPAATAPPGGTCPPCPTFGAFQANDIGVYSECAPILTPTPTPYPVITPCPTVSPTGCDVVTYPIGDADCNFAVNGQDALAIIGEAAGGTPVPCHDLGNVRCDDGLNVLDALFILQYKAGLTAHIPAWCPPIGAMIFSNFAAR